MEHYRAVWPLLSEAGRRPLRELVAEAESDLPWMLAVAHVRRAAVGRPRWTIRPGRDVPGSGGAPEVLVLDLPVVRVPRGASVDAVELADRVASVARVAS